MWDTIITQGIHPTMVVLFVAILLGAIVVAWRFRLLLVLKMWLESGASTEELARVIEVHEGRNQQANGNVRFAPNPATASVENRKIGTPMIVEVAL